MFPLSPDNGFTTNILGQGGSCSAAVGSNQACYVLRWEHYIQPAGWLLRCTTVWQIEGIANLDGDVTLPSSFQYQFQPQYGCSARVSLAWSA